MTKIINKIKLHLILLSAGMLFPFLAYAASGAAHESKKSGPKGVFASALEGVVLYVLELFYDTAAKILAWAGLILDFAIEFSITDFNLYVTDFVRFGWTMCRDMTNFIFIFALIFIGIATILQVQSYGFRRLLVAVILAALLVNFSATITFVIIDASNLVATEFLCAATAGTCDAELVSAIISNSLKFQTVVANNTGTVSMASLTFGKQAMIYIFGTGIFLFVAFIFSAGAVMFIMRAFVLMFLIIFSPFAFVGTALGMGSAKQWWSKLFSEAITAPVYFFLFYVVVMYLTWAEGLIETGTNTFYDMVTGSDATAVVMISNFIVMAGFLFGILIVSQKLGAMGSAGAIRMLQGSARKVGGVVRATPRVLVGAAAGGAVAGAAYAARKADLAERIPVTSNSSAWLKEKLQGLERGGTKSAQARTDKQVKRGLGLSPKERAEFMKNSNSVVQKEMFNKMSARDRADMKNQGGSSLGFNDIYNKLKKDLSPEEKEKTEKSEADLQKKADIAKLATPTVTSGDFKKLHETLTGDDLRNLASDATKEGQEAATRYFDSLKTIGGTVNSTVDEIADQLSLMGNKAQASWIRTTAARQILEKEYGVGKKIEEKETKAEEKLGPSGHPQGTILDEHGNPYPPSS